MSGAATDQMSKRKIAFELYKAFRKKYVRRRVNVCSKNDS